MEQRPHAELIKSWADGADIECKQISGKWLTSNVDRFFESNEYRIKPDCEYAFEKIREKGGDELVEVYKHWLNGGEIEVRLINGEYKDPIDEDKKPKENPLKQFLYIYDYYGGLRIKSKQKLIKQEWAILKTCPEVCLVGTMMTEVNQIPSITESTLKAVKTKIIEVEE